MARTQYYRLQSSTTLASTRLETQGNCKVLGGEVTRLVVDLPTMSMSPPDLPELWAKLTGSAS